MRKHHVLYITWKYLILFFHLPFADVQFAQLCFRGFGWRVGERAPCGLGFREGHDVADGFGARHQHDEAVKAKGDAAMRRAAVFECVQQEAEFFLGFFCADAEAFEDALLHVVAVDADGAAADFGTVQHHVVGTREDVAGVGVQFVEVRGFRLGEGVVHGVPAAVFFVVFEHREVHHPERRPVAGEHVEVLPDFDAQGADGVVDDAGFVCAEEDEVAVLRVHPFDDVECNRAFRAAFGGEEFDDG